MVSDLERHGTVCTLKTGCQICLSFFATIPFLLQLVNCVSVPVFKCHVMSDFLSSSGHQFAA